MMETKQCKICGWYSDSDLCKTHSKEYKWESNIQSYRLKKRNTGSRYTKHEYHKSEIQLTKIIESFYGPDNIFTSVHPIWAVTRKHVLYEFDIYIKSRKVFIEYNGEQHYKFTRFFHKTRSEYLKQIRRDKRKRSLATTNGFQVITFKYDEPIFKDYVINKIERELLCNSQIIEFSQF